MNKHSSLVMKNSIIIFTRFWSLKFHPLLKCIGNFFLLLKRFWIIFSSSFSLVKSTSIYIQNWSCNSPYYIVCTGSINTLGVRIGFSESSKVLKAGPQKSCSRLNIAYIKCGPIISLLKFLFFSLGRVVLKIFCWIDSSMMNKVHLLGLNTLFISDMNPSNRSKGLSALCITGHCIENFSSFSNSTKAGAAFV